MEASTSADSTRDRIVTAARAEFARYGIAGARITRIAKTAKTSSERLYAYFRSKEELYRFVAEQELAAVLEATHLDPTDLPEYAGRVHDYFLRHPDRFRFMSWGRLELAGDAADSVTQETFRRKAEQLRKAQEAGHLDPAWDPIDVLVFVGQLATAWAGQLDLVDAAADQVRDPSPSARRAAVVAAVQRLFPAAAAGDADVGVGVSGGAEKTLSGDF
ncbi:TetR family transcriptional regulator [Streptomyces sp. NPDC020898]|uniref:TetR family transcriptional regulator n=1 Tax=Streptomyces sp. NPDC020898 TaxID=3365101 RepID=UPI0037ABFFA1